MNISDFRILTDKIGVPIRTLSVENVAKLKVSPQAQRRTARFKKSVYIVEDLVFKGPYACDDPRLLNSLRYAYALQLLEEALQLDEWQRGSQPWECLGCGDDNQYYLVASNVGRRNKIPFELVSTKIETNVKVVPRGGHVFRVSDLERNGQLTDDIRSAALQHLYLRFLLGIGDSGTHNILIREDSESSGRLVVGVDLEERRAVRVVKRRLELLFKRAPSKRQNCLYESNVCGIKILSYNQLDRRILNRLSSVGIDLKGLKENIELWQKLK